MQRGRDAEPGVEAFPRLHHGKQVSFELVELSPLGRRFAASLADEAQVAIEGSCPTVRAEEVVAEKTLHLPGECGDGGSHPIPRLFFGLLHTHFGSDGDDDERELVRREDGQNCSEAGDLLCDTPADPGPVNRNEEEGCRYEVTSPCRIDSCGSDPTGDGYGSTREFDEVAFLGNVMSYYEDLCNVEYFTVGQSSRIMCVMRDWIEESDAFIGVDLDGDGYGDDTTALTQCLPPAGPYVLAGGDCADDDASRFPDAPELCNSIDDDCDGTPDDPPTTGDGSWYVDLDGDGYGDENSSETTCDPAPGLIEQGGDCDDADRAVNPDATEVCNDGVDNNCDSVPDPCLWPATSDMKDHAVFVGVSEEDFFGRQVVVGDLDGDGRDEAIVSAYTALNTATGDRNGFIYGLGPTAQISQQLDDADYRLSGGTGYETAGVDFEVADVDGDAYDDLLVGGYDVEPDHPLFGAGAAFFVRGPVSGNIRESAAWSVYGEEAYYILGSDVAIVADMSGDGALDFVVGSTSGLDNGYDSGAAFLISGAASGTLDLYTDPIAAFYGDDENYKLGADVHSIDLDADGQPELAIGAPRAHGYAGGVALFQGSLRGDHLYTDGDILLSGEGGGVEAGYSLDSLGDINRDGYEDLVVGGHHDTAYIVWGAASASSMLLADADVKIRGDQSTEVFGDKVFAVDDLNQDGTVDLAVGTISGSDECHVYLYFGPLSARAVLSATPDADSILNCDGVNDHVISSVAAGDVNGDTVPDLVVGMDWAGTDNSGEAVIVLGTGF